MFEKGDVESGGNGERPLYPTMVENPQQRWSFIWKVYTIITFQLVLTTIAVASVVIFIQPIAHFFVSFTQGSVLYIVLIIFVPIIILCSLNYYQQKYPLNYFFLFIFMLGLAFANGLFCALESRKVILEAFILTSGVVLSLTLYTFWAARRGHDFNFLGPFLFVAFVVHIIFLLIQILFHLGELSLMIYGCLGSIIYCGCIIYDTDNLIKKLSYDEYIRASVLLYLCIMNLFISTQLLLVLMTNSEAYIKYAFIIYQLHTIVG